MAIVTAINAAIIIISITAIIFMVLFYEITIFFIVNALHVLEVVEAPEKQGA